MSRYLIRRIEETPNIHLHVHTQIEALEGDAKLERVTWDEALTTMVGALLLVSASVACSSNAAKSPTKRTM